jgi:DNA processing protein
MNPARAWLGLAMFPAFHRFCRELTDKQVLLLYRSTVKTVADILGVDNDTAGRVRRSLAGVDFDREEKRLSDLNISVVTLADARYPRRLRDIYDPPPALFYLGEFPVEGPSVGIVGSRRASAYGRSMATDMARELAAAGIEIVSGLARGIDGAAHTGALENGRTIAVLGCGLDIIYPREHRRLSRDICGAGAVVTEYPPGTPPRPLNFPARNRLISGLADGVVIVEASVKSGALITADFALEQGREVMAVPGSARSPSSAGCHKLLQQGAALVTGAGDVLNVMSWDGWAETGPLDKTDGILTAVQARLLEILGFEPVRADNIFIADGRPPPDILGDLTVLELHGYISRQEGGRYCRVR